jgi:ubiquinone/menaquinone biosynthesis C-methylase UbiE
MHAALLAEAASRGLHVNVTAGSASALSAPGASYDAVLGTLVLCSVDSLPAAVAEVQRVLRPGGRFIFLEHVAADDVYRRRRECRSCAIGWRCVCCWRCARLPLNS